MSADGARSNSFHYTVDAAMGALARPHWSACPVRATAPHWPVGRVVFLRRGDRVGRFSTATRDFDDGALRAVVHGLGQLYLDVSQKPSLDDFARDLVALDRSPVCAGCPVVSACAGLFEASPVDRFTRDDGRVRAWLSTLAGTVLDVGCGEAPYADVFDGAVRARTVRYVGIDPDARRIEALRARWPDADLRVAAAEDPLDLAVDHALVLRSWNHLRNPVRVLETFAQIVRPGGSLTVVDNVAFGVVRGRAQARAAEASGSGFEHLRNDDASTAHGVIDLFSRHFELVERCDVGPGTSNQWMLRYTRRGAVEGAPRV